MLTPPGGSDRDMDKSSGKGMGKGGVWVYRIRRMVLLQQLVHGSDLIRCAQVEHADVGLHPRVRPPPFEVWLLVEDHAPGHDRSPVLHLGGEGRGGMGMGGGVLPVGDACRRYL
jgi:hypothetical protein